MFCRYGYVLIGPDRTLHAESWDTLVTHVCFAYRRRATFQVRARTAENPRPLTPREHDQLIADVTARMVPAAPTLKPAGG